MIHGGDAAVGVHCGTDGGHDDDGDYSSYSVQQNTNLLPKAR